MVERSMIEGRTVLVTCVDDDLRPVADRLQATFIQITFERRWGHALLRDRQEQGPAVEPLRRVTPFRRPSPPSSSPLSRIMTALSNCFDSPEESGTNHESIARSRYHTTADWHFTTANARIKLKHLYPSI